MSLRFGTKTNTLSADDALQQCQIGVDDGNLKVLDVNCVLK